MKSFKGKRILVTGGCQGIGKGVVSELWRQGATVVAISDMLDKLKDLQNEYPSVEIEHIDLKHWDKTRNLVESLGVFHGLVNSAGIAITEPFLECKVDSYDKIMAVNARAVLNVTQIVTRKMVENKINGSVVSVSSQASLAALQDHVAYCASKGAVDAMTRVMALELGPHGIRVNTVNPTVIMTEMGRTVWAPPEKSQPMLAKIPLGRFGEVHEVVNAILFLLSDDASMINGIQLPVDGGFLAT